MLCLKSENAAPMKDKECVGWGGPGCCSPGEEVESVGWFCTQKAQIAALLYTSKHQHVIFRQQH